MNVPVSSFITSSSDQIKEYLRSKNHSISDNDLVNLYNATIVAYNANELSDDNQYIAADPRFKDLCLASFENIDDLALLLEIDINQEIGQVILEILKQPFCVNIATFDKHDYTSENRRLIKALYLNQGEAIAAYKKILEERPEGEFFVDYVWPFDFWRSYYMIHPEIIQIEGHDLHDAGLYVSVAQSGNLPVVTDLLNKSLADPTIMENFNPAYLLFSAGGGAPTPNVIEFFMKQYNASADLHDEFFNTPLTMAARCGRMDNIIYLLQNGALVDLRKTLQEQGNPNFQKINDPVAEAAKSNNSGIVQFLLQQGADPNGVVHEDRFISHRTPMYFAIAYNNLLMVEHLAPFKALTNDKDNLPVKMALECGCDGIAMHLLQNGYTLTQEEIDGNIQLSPQIQVSTIQMIENMGLNIAPFIVCFGNEEILTYSMSKGVDINSKFSDDDALTVAIQCNSKENIQLLLRKGVIFTQTHANGITKLNNRDEMMEFLTKIGVQMNNQQSS